MRRQTFALTVGYLLAALGLADVGLRCIEIGIDDGLLAAAHDPGKVVFHVLLLPVASAVLVLEFPIHFLRSAWSRSTTITVVIALVLFALAAGLAADDIKAGFCERRSSPADLKGITIKDPSTGQEYSRSLLLKIRRDWRNHVVSIPFGSEVDEEIASDLEQRYDAVLAGIRRPGCSFIDQSSLKAKWSGFLTFLGIAFVALLLWLIFLHLMMGERPSESFANIALVVVSLLAPWLVLRAYSEWYINFGTVGFRSYPALVVALIVLGLIAFQLYVLRSTRRVLPIVAGLIAFLSAAFALLSDFNASYFGIGATAFASLEAIPLLTIYVLIALTIIGTIRFLLQPPSD